MTQKLGRQALTRRVNLLKKRTQPEAPICPTLCLISFICTCTILDNTILSLTDLTNDRQHAWRPEILMIAYHFSLCFFFKAMHLRQQRLSSYDYTRAHRLLPSNWRSRNIECTAAHHFMGGLFRYLSHHHLAQCTYFAPTRMQLVTFNVDRKIHSCVSQAINSMYILKRSGTWSCNKRQGTTRKNARGKNQDESSWLKLWLSRLRSRHLCQKLPSVFRSCPYPPALAVRYPSYFRLNIVGTNAQTSSMNYRKTEKEGKSKYLFVFPLHTVSGKRSNEH